MNQQHSNAEGGGGPNESENTNNDHAAWSLNMRGRGRGMRPAPQDSFRQHPLSSENPYSEIVKNSVLSVDAAEFVPKTFTPAPQMNAGHGSRSSVQDRLRLARQNQNVHQAMVQRNQGQQPWQQQQQWQPRHQSHRQNPQHHQPPQHYQHHQQSQHHQYSDGGYRGAQHQHYNQYSNIQDYGQNDGGSVNFSDKSDTGPVDLPTCLMKLEMDMNTLTMNPGMFDNLVAHLVNTVTPYLEQPSDCEQVFNVILKQSIDEGNFRYSGARLCTHLDTVVLGDKSTSTFRETLINQCKQKTEEQADSWKEITQHTDEIEKKCHGLIFFLAELVTQMEPTPASELGKLLIRLINTVLQNPAPNSAKNICQALKLAGQTLERDNSGNRSEMEQVMRTLSDLVIQGRVDSHVGRMVSSVSELRSGNWGVTPSHTTREMENKQPSSSQVTDEPVFYGPDGQEITEEESRFLEEGDIEGEIAAQEPWENEEEADEVAAAYEEFLMLSMHNNKQNEKNVQSKF